MLDFIRISNRVAKGGTIEIYPKFIVKTSSDLMVRGGDFYAIWIEELGLWSTDEQDVVKLIDRELDIYVEENKHVFGPNPRVLYMWDADSGMIDKWHKYCQKQMWDSFNMLDETLIFSNTDTKKTDYASKKLTYPLDQGDISGYDKLMSVLYSEEERHKIEWAIGSIVTGDSKTLQKFLVLYGSAGTGKSTVLNIIQQLFEGYYSVFDAKALGSASNVFALEAFKTNPLVAIQHDGDLSKIEDNTRLNSLVSHELMTVNEKFKSTYSNRFKAFLFMGTNKPVKITEAKSGLMRRLIDVTPTGNKLPSREYDKIMKKVEFELGAIAYHCREVYLSDPSFYDDYMPLDMLGASNDFYNFIIDAYRVFKNDDGTTLKAAWEMYKLYCEEARVPYPLSQRNFKEELKNYFHEFHDRFVDSGGNRLRSYFHGFRDDKYDKGSKPKKKEENSIELIQFDSTESIFDKECCDYPAQYANDAGGPRRGWDNITTKLSDINTSEVHYVRVPENHIVIDFDIPDENGNKSFEKNIAEASKWPPTYAELSKSGGGIHLHYIYNGDVNRLSRVYGDHIEVKVYKGKGALRRRLSKCNNLPIATISSGLPLKGDDKLVSQKVIKSEKGLRSLIRRNLEKDIHPHTKPSIEFMYNILDKAYKRGMHYDISDMLNEVYAFAANSTNNANYCLDLVSRMKFKSDDISLAVDNEEAPIVFYDVEVFPNLFLVNWKVRGEGNPVIRMINPRPADIEMLLGYRLVGFNCRNYDNHMLYACMMGYTNEQLYKLSQKIINKDKDISRKAKFGEAYNISYTDVYDFAATKQSLKKWEIELGIRHQELGLPWDQPVPEELWSKVAEYCDNDVLATEAVFDHLVADFTARQILVDLAGEGSTVNDTTNTLTQRIIFGKEKNPQSKFNYRNLAEPVNVLSPETREFLEKAGPEMMATRHGEANSLLPYFPGYKHEYGKSIYRDEEVGEGGYVYSEPGIYGNVGLYDVVSMHPHSAIMEALFGVEFTTSFKEIVDGRVDIKHEAWDKVNTILDGKLAPYIQKVLDGEMTSTDLAYALKIAINSVYGLTSAGFPNAFKDPRNKDNIVAKRGALFMVDLKHEVQKRGFIVAHIKTDSIKIPDATPEITEFIMEFGKKYGYTFEHEATYDRMCLVNDAVYIAKYATEEKCMDLYGYVPGDNKKKPGKWTATGTQFQVPYVFKTLFSKEPIEFADMCETKSVTSSLYLDFNETLPDVSGFEKEFKKAESDYKKGKLSDTDFERICADLAPKIEEGHDYHFVGRVGLFSPVKSGQGGGILCREKDGKYYAATGSKGYRWVESTFISDNYEDAIDRSYYNALVDDAAESIAMYGNFEWFVSDDPYNPPPYRDGKPVYVDELPWD
jgi:hypothetical protein